MKHCSIPECKAVAKAAKLCSIHYRLERAKKLGNCTISGCDRLQHTKSMCRMHAYRLDKFGSVGAADPMYNRGSGKSLTSDDYVRIYEPTHPLSTSQGWVLEHRKIMYYLGLLDDESIVHHINHDKQDNSVQNLQVMTHEEHARLHMDERNHDQVRN